MKRNDRSHARNASRYSWRNRSPRPTAAVAVPAFLPNRYHVHVSEAPGFAGVTYAWQDGTVLPVKHSGQDDRFWEPLERYRRGSGDIG